MLIKVKTTLIIIIFERMNKEHKELKE